MVKHGQEYKELLARIEDCIEQAEKGMLSYTKFLSPAEGFCAKEILLFKGLMKRACFLGGYVDAERARLVVLPSYLDGIDKDAHSLFSEYFPDDADELVRVIKITGSGYKTLSHRDYLGAILGLGVERDALGDIVTLDDFTAYAFVSDAIARLMLDSLTFIGSDKVKLQEIRLDGDFKLERKLLRLTDTVASARFDCVVASLANVSREKAQSCIGGGLCLLNYFEETRCDATVRAGDIITVRGYGKFIVRELDEKTKKGRLRLIFDKYV